MRNKRKGIVCVIIAFFMLFSGMCLENVQTDSSFACAAARNITSYMTSQDMEIVKSEAYTTESINVRNTSYVQQRGNRSSQSRRVMKGSMEFLHINQESQIVSNFYTAADMVQLPELYSKTAVLNYIHNQDGKKRISGLA